MHTAGWTGLLYLLCTARFAACELKQMDQFHYLASSKVYGNATLPCNAKLMLQNVPQTVIRWYKDEKDITVTPRKHRVSVDHHGNLKMQKLREYDSGVYACQVGFPGGTEVIWSQTIAAGKAAKAEKNKGDAVKSEGDAEKSEGDESSEEDESSSETE
uniref:Ig-like domain-containing protein n=1 Tax=Branchiostoma floridae TaxID=7739 RepID=C3XWQ9_BRAFL|eukprot:XP_002611159.1 hypothetical protein BRAFLDRAFT_88442 [Branchiostoma floridae]